MTTQRKTEVQFYMTIISTLLLIVFVPIASWSLLRNVDQGERIAVVESQQQAFIAQGERYTQGDAKKDFAPLIEKVNDHELRIRLLE